MWAAEVLSPREGETAPSQAASTCKPPASPRSSLVTPPGEMPPRTPVWYAGVTASSAASIHGHGSCGTSAALVGRSRGLGRSAGPFPGSGSAAQVQPVARHHCKLTHALPAAACGAPCVVTCVLWSNRQCECSSCFDMQSPDRWKGF